MENITEYVITKVQYQWIAELFSGLNLTTSLYKPEEVPLLIKKDYQLLSNIRKATTFQAKEGRSPLFNFERYRSAYPPEKYYSREQWDKGLIRDALGWTILRRTDIPPIESEECYSYYNNRRECQIQHKELEEQKISANSSNIDDNYKRLDEILFQIKQGDGQLKDHLAEELELVSANIEELSRYPYTSVAPCRYTLGLETELFFESHLIHKVYCDLEMYSGFLQYGLLGQPFSLDSVDHPHSKGDNFQQWQKSTSKVSIDVHYGHYPYCGYLQLSPFRYDYKNLNVLDHYDPDIPSLQEGLLHSPHYNFAHEYRSITKKYRFSDIKTYPINTKQIVVTFPEKRPYPLVLEVTKKRSIRVYFIDNPSNREPLQELELGGTYLFLSRYFLIEILEPEFDPQYYPPNFAVKSKPFQRLTIEPIPVEDNEETDEDTEKIPGFVLSGRYPLNFPCLELAYHHEFLGLQDWNMEMFTTEAELFTGDVNGPSQIRSHLATIKVYDDYKELIEEEMGGFDE